MTTEAAEAGVRTDEDGPSWPEGPDRQYCGYVIIEWPAPQGKDGIPRAMPAWGCTIIDAATGKLIVTAEKVAVERVTADVTGFIIADLVMLADPDGNPVLGPGENGKCDIYPDGKGGFLRGVFPFIVAEMRVRQP